MIELNTINPKVNDTYKIIGKLGNTLGLLTIIEVDHNTKMITAEGNGKQIEFDFLTFEYSLMKMIIIPHNTHA